MVVCNKRIRAMYKYSFSCCKYIMSWIPATFDQYCIHLYSFSHNCSSNANYSWNLYQLFTILLLPFIYPLDVPFSHYPKNGLLLGVMILILGWSYCHELPLSPCSVSLFRILPYSKLLIWQLVRDLLSFREYSRDSLNCCCISKYALLILYRRMWLSTDLCHFAENVFQVQMVYLQVFSYS